MEVLQGAGLLLWNQSRQQWLANKKPQNRPQVREPSIRCLTFSVSYTEHINISAQPFFILRIPLVVDILVSTMGENSVA